MHSWGDPKGMRMFAIPRRYFLGGLAATGFGGLFANGLKAASREREWLAVYPSGLSPSVPRVFGIVDRALSGEASAVAVFHAGFTVLQVIQQAHMISFARSTLGRIWLNPDFLQFQTVLGEKKPTGSEGGQSRLQMPGKNPIYLSS